MIEVIRKVVNALERGHFIECGFDLLIRIDEKEWFTDCKNCIVRDIEADMSLCPYRHLLVQEVL